MATHVAAHRRDTALGVVHEAVRSRAPQGSARTRTPPPSPSHDPDPAAARQPATRMMLSVADEVTSVGLRAIVGSCDNLQVQFHGTDFDAALLHARQHLPDVWITDSCFDGDCVLAALGSAPVDTGVVVFTDHASIEVLRAALDAGALGFVLRSASPTTIREAILQVAQGCRFVDPTLAHGLIGEPARALTPRETDVLRLYAEGHTTSEIAASLFISSRTVESCRSSLKRKLGLSTRAELHLYARTEGLFTPGCSCA